MERYNRQLILPEIGEEGQARLKQARVLIVGVGGLGSPIALYLTGAGVGNIGLVDDDVVSETNLENIEHHVEKLKPDLLVVDSGTAITLDLVTADGCFRGGNIAPGIATRFASLSGHCARLPLLDAEGDIPLVGYDTATAIRSGVVMGVVAQVKQMYAELKADYPRLLVVLTGGDCNIIAKRLNLEEMEVNENLVTIGLNRILEHNESI